MLSAELCGKTAWAHCCTSGRKISVSSSPATGCLSFRKRIRSAGPCCVLAEHLSTHRQFLKWLPLKLGSEEDLLCSAAVCYSPSWLDESSCKVSPINLVWCRNRLAEKTTVRQMVVMVKVVFPAFSWVFLSPPVLKGFAWYPCQESWH